MNNHYMQVGMVQQACFNINRQRQEEKREKTFAEILIKSIEEVKNEQRQRQNRGDNQGASV